MTERETEIRAMMLERFVRQSRSDASTPPGTWRPNSRRRMFVRQHHNVRVPPRSEPACHELRFDEALARLRAGGPQEEFDECYARLTRASEEDFARLYEACENAGVMAAWEITDGEIRELDSTEFARIELQEVREGYFDVPIVDFWVDVHFSVVHITRHHQTHCSFGWSPRIECHDGELRLDEPWSSRLP